MQLGASLLVCEGSANGAGRAVARLLVRGELRC